MSPDSQRIAMKTKLKPTPRKMWANYYPLAGWSHPCIHPTLLQAQATAAGDAKPVRVAVIPLNDPDALIRVATDAYFSSLEKNTENRWRDTLAAIGVLPRKGGRK